MLCIYLSSEPIRFWVEETGVDCIITQDYEEWAQYSGRRVAMIEIINFDDDTHDMVSRACADADLAVLFMPEFITDQWCREFDLEHVVFFLPGFLKTPLLRSRQEFLPYFFWATCDFYHTYPELLSVLRPYDIKQKHFDVLLGRQKPHRDIIWRDIDRQDNIVTYFPTAQDLDITSYDEQSFIWPSEVTERPDHPVNMTTQELIINGTIVSLSQVIPTDIYNRSCYSLVAETQWENGWSFFTEKIAKPMLARRLFLVASGQGYLANLRRLGFRTFEGVIDESYDQEPNCDIRMQMVLEQAKILSAMDQRTVLDQVQDITEHNFSLMHDTQWQSSMIDRLKHYLM